MKSKEYQLLDNGGEDSAKSRNSNYLGQFRTQDDELVRDGEFEILQQDNVEFEYMSNYPSLLSSNHLDQM